MSGLTVRVSRIANRILAQNEAMKLSDKAMKVAEFLLKHPSPKDESFHKWAEDQGYKVDETEAAAYELASLFATFVLKGRANEKKLKAEDVDKDELKMGIAVEHEHTNSDEVAERISLDHLAEIPDYYTRLKKMEDEAKS